MKTVNIVKTNSLSNNIKIITAIALIAGACSTQAMDRQSEKELTIGGSIIAGALVGGPIGGFVAGVAAGLYGDHVDVVTELETTEKNMNLAENTITELENEISTMESNLAYLESESTRLEQTLMTRLEFQVMFRTGNDELSEFDKERIAALVEYLNRNPELSVRLDGHTDQRGTEEYNNLLAKYRAESVAEALLINGISKSRIITQSHGSSMAAAKSGDYEGYALDRRVNIEVFNSDISNAENGVASLN